MCRRFMLGKVESANSLNILVKLLIMRRFGSHFNLLQILHPLWYGVPSATNSVHNELSDFTDERVTTVVATNTRPKSNRRMWTFPQWTKYTNHTRKWHDVHTTVYALQEQRPNVMIPFWNKFTSRVPVLFFSVSKIVDTDNKTVYSC